MKERFELYPGYDISRILKGHWQMSDDHVRGPDAVTTAQAIEDCRLYVGAGVTTFDVADIYTGAEVLIGEFNKQYQPAMRRGDLPQVQIHTKYVPDRANLSTVDFNGTEAIIDRSLQRLNVEQLDLVQFHWWDLSIPRYVEVAQHLKELKQRGKIRAIGVTNFDQESLKQLVDAGIPIVSTQVQYSVMDQRPKGDFTDFCLQNGISMLCYGSLSGGFLQEKYLGASDPGGDLLALPNRSLTKYKLIIDEFGGWDVYQQLLETMADIGQRSGVNLSTVAMRYILQQQGVAGLVVGAHNSDHLGSLQQLEMLPPSADLSALDTFLANVDSPLNKRGIYQMERGDERHKSVMKYDLNAGKAKLG